MLVGLAEAEMFLFCHVISRDLMIKEAFDLASWNPSALVTTVPGLMEIEIEHFNFVLWYHTTTRLKADVT